MISNEVIIAARAGDKPAVMGTVPPETQTLATALNSEPTHEHATIIERPGQELPDHRPGAQPPGFWSYKGLTPRA